MLLGPWSLLNLALLVLLRYVIRPRPELELADLEWILSLPRISVRRSNGLGTVHRALQLLDRVEWALGRLPHRTRWQRHCHSYALLRVLVS